MSDEPPYAAEAPPPPRANFGCGSLLLGFLLCPLFLLLGAVDRGRSIAVVLILIPVGGIALAVAPRTRGIGVGLLIAYALGWLVLLAICGQAIRI